MNDSPTNLELATLDELVGEIQRRTLASLVLYTLDAKNNPDEKTHTIGYSGSYHAAVGLAIDFVGGSILKRYQDRP